jgi:thiol-disulfide isomerase/thioredoxin
MKTAFAATELQIARRHLLLGTAVAGASLVVPAVVMGQAEPPVSGFHGSAKPPFAMPWPAQLTLLDGSSWRPPSPADAVAVVLVFWSVTCPFCDRHHPAVHRLQTASAGRGLRVITAAQEATDAPGRERVRLHLQQGNWPLPVLREHDALRRIFGTRRVTPTTVVIDRQGLVREVIPGLMSEDDVLGLLERYAPL